jgi:hypothetical protein
MMGDAPHENLGFKYGAVSQIGTNGIECLPEAPRVRSKETHEGVAVGSTPGSHILKELQEARHPAAHVRVAFREESFQLIEGGSDGLIVPALIEIAEQSREFKPLPVVITGSSPDLRGRQLRKRPHQFRESGFLIDHMDLALVTWIEPSPQKADEEWPGWASVRLDGVPGYAR